jgi:endonuclease/exonuclease/phosphatase family metal-dependent hydrolase
MPQAELILTADVRVEVTAVHPLPPLSVANYQDWLRDLAALPPAARSGSARILIGDYNATLDHAQFRELLGRGYADAADRVGKGLIPTWGVRQQAPPLTIDHILVDERVAVRRVEVHAIPGSDHRAVFAELRLP